MVKAHIITTFTTLSLLTGCAAWSGVERTNLSKIERGMVREQAEQILGNPIAITPTSRGLAAAYEYNKGTRPLPGSDLGYLIFMPYFWPVAEHETVSKQLGTLTVLYDQDQRVVSVFKADQRAVLRGIAEGSPATLFKLGRLSTPGSEFQFLWYCLAAQVGHPVAQYLLAARFYEEGKGQLSRDLGKALFWYSMASLNGDDTAASRSKKMRAVLSPEEISEVEKRVATWEPNVASCKGELDRWEGDATALDLLDRLLGLHK
jgi:hypothetical protein